MRSNLAMPDDIRVRVFTEEKKLLKEMARMRGVSLSELVRSAAFSQQVMK